MKDKLRALVCAADNAMQNGDYRKAIDVLRKICDCDAGGEVSMLASGAMKEMPAHGIKMHSPQWDKAHAFIGQLCDLTQNKEDKIIPDTK